MLSLIPAQMPRPLETLVMAKKRMSEMTPIERETVFILEESWRTVNMLRPR